MLVIERTSPARHSLIPFRRKIRAIRLRYEGLGGQEAGAFRRNAGNRPGLTIYRLLPHRPRHSSQIGQFGYRQPAGDAQTGDEVLQLAHLAAQAVVQYPAAIHQQRGVGDPQRWAFDQYVLQPRRIVTVLADQPVGFGDGVGLAVPGVEPFQVGDIRPVVQTGIARAGPALPVDGGVDLEQGSRFGGRRGGVRKSLATTRRQQQGQREPGDKWVWEGRHGGECSTRILLPRVLAPCGGGVRLFLPRGVR
jgi:hypothetical protein